VILALLMGLLAPVSTRAQNGEFTNKASLIFRFAKYTTWQGDKKGSGGPFVIGVIGQDNISDTIRDQIRGTRIKDREVIVKPISTTQEIAGCHILFVSRSEAARLGPITSAARRNNVLSVGETENFEKEGGVITFVMENGAVKFTLNERNRRRSDLKMDLEMFQIAYRVNDR
jgi:hypothetical protein